MNEVKRNTEVLEGMGMDANSVKMAIGEHGGDGQVMSKREM